MSSEAGPAAGTGYCAFGARTLLRLVEALDEQASGARRGGDVEFVHRTRVATRRTRGALTIFRDCFREELYGHWRDEVREVTAAMGRARDLDVQIIFLEKYAASLRGKRARAAMSRVVERHHGLREAAQVDVVAAVDRLAGSGVVGSIRDTCTMMTADAGNSHEASASVYRGACEHIARRVEGLLDLEGCVEDPDAWTEHHRMRIAAKRLRYALEIFEPLYGETGAVWVPTLKGLQDVLGEMHDCDVWTMEIPAIRKEMVDSIQAGSDADHVATEVGAVLDRLATDIAKRRARLHGELGKAWRSLREGGFFEGVVEEAVTRFIESRTGGRIALIGDVHGNVPALEAVLDDARERGATAIIDTGDSVGFGPDPRGVIERLACDGVLSIAGNYDLEVLEWRRDRPFVEGLKGESLMFTGRQVGGRGAAFLRARPRAVRFRFGGRRFLVVHGSPASIDEKVGMDTPDEHLRVLAGIADADAVVVGHTHAQMDRCVSGVHFVNPGSVGRPDDGDSRAGYAIVTSEPFGVEHLRVEYDVSSVADATRKAGLPEEFAQMFLQGRAIGDVDMANVRLIEKVADRAGRAAILEAVRAVAARYDPDPGHTEQVRRLALRLFDGTRRLHRLSGEDRLWLECAAILHDTGWAIGAKGHHKASMRIILNELELPFTTRERLVVANVARYHRKAHPEEWHHAHNQLDVPTRGRVDRAAALLRLADGLDASHGAIVERLSVRSTTDRVSIRCFVKADPSLERDMLPVKVSLFEEVFGRKVSVAFIGSGS
ncbi:MAG: CHAD domain-containing protein [Thermoplasmata archaeon]|nr:CHAD domain-containing protein [Thermoplasmata archaeon]